MTTETYLWCFLAGLLGIAFYIFAIKIPAIKERAKVANTSFTYSGYLKNDLNAILASLLTVIILLVVLDELVAIKPAVVPFLKISFVTVGYMGSSVMVAVLGKAQKKLNEIIDVKTDKADGK